MLERPTPCPSRKTEPLSPLGARRRAAGCGRRSWGKTTRALARSSASKRASLRVFDLVSPYPILLKIAGLVEDCGLSTKVVDMSAEPPVHVG